VLSLTRRRSRAPSTCRSRGVRDLSVIETAPLERLPVETHICRFSREVVREALERELQRGGQVFFVHNRIQSLSSMARFIQKMAPDARVVMAHGQLKERELEAGDGQVHDGAGGRARLDGDRRVGARHPRLEYDHHQPRRPLRPRPALPTPRACGAASASRPTPTSWSRPTGRMDEQAERRLRVLQELTCKTTLYLSLMSYLQEINE